MRHYFIVFFHLMYLLSFLGYSFLGFTLQNGIISQTLILLTVLTCNYFSKEKSLYKKFILLDYLIFHFIFWSLFSILDVFISNRSYFVYLKGITYCLFPIMAYFIFSFNRKKIELVSINIYLKYIVTTSVIAVFVGLVFYFTTPGFYVNYVLSSYEGLINSEDMLFMARLLSYFGDPTAIGNVATLSLPILFYLNKTNENFLKYKGLTTTFVVVLYLGVIFSFARSAWVATILFTIYYSLFKTKNALIKLSMVCVIILSIVGLNILANINVDDLVLLELQKRINSVGGSFEDRNFQLQYGLDLITNNPFGVGLGQAGHKSFSGDIFKGVFDNNYLRILSETGIFGFLSLLFIIFVSLLMTFYKSIDNKINELRWLLLMLLGIFYFQAIGSNILDLHYSSFLFWSFLGILSWTFKVEYNKHFLKGT